MVQSEVRGVKAPKLKRDARIRLMVLGSLMRREMRDVLSGPKGCLLAYEGMCMGMRTGLCGRLV